ncbi:MAG: DUF2095 family protein [Candidatus Lokiarchaeota archaeon]|nr:DUF2095 family protein [Candidatus Lokiarchaeota archaeon]
MERKNKNKEIINKLKVENEEGLTVSYEKDELKEKFPYLITEIAGKKKSLKIDSIENNTESTQLKVEKPYPDELINPTAIDFLRRCTNNNEALSILDYLLKQEEISEKDYNSFKNQILKGEGLKTFIDKHGGFKSHGYYEKKYRNVTQNKIK